MASKQTHEALHKPGYCASFNTHPIKKILNGLIMSVKLPCVPAVQGVLRMKHTWNRATPVNMNNTWIRSRHGPGGMLSGIQNDIQ